MTTNGGFSRWMLRAGILSACAVMLGWANTWEDVRRESANIQSVNAHFTQEKHMDILTKPLVSQGRFYFQAPDSVRWEYFSPVRSVVIMRKGNIKRYMDSGKGFVETPGGSLESMQIVLAEISRWSRGKFTENEHFSATLKRGRGAQIILTPKEKGISHMISRIVITLSADRPGVIQSVRIVESGRNYTLFTFHDVRVNETIADALFREAG